MEIYVKKSHNLHTACITAHNKIKNNITKQEKWRLQASINNFFTFSFNDFFHLLKEKENIFAS